MLCCWSIYLALLDLGCIMDRMIQILQLSIMDLNLDSLLNIADKTVDRRAFTDIVKTQKQSDCS
jgi:hypothetical protein